MKHVTPSVRSIPSAKKDYSWNLSICVCENVDDSKIVSNEIIYVMDIVSTNMTNTIATNATCTVSLNFDNKKINCCIHTTLTFFISIPLKQPYSRYA